MSFLRSTTQPPAQADAYEPPMPTLRTSRARQAHLRPVERITEEPVITRRRRLHLGKPGLGIVAGMLVALALWLMWQQAVLPAWGNLQDQWHYGDSPITQLDANVGHDGESHFLAEYDQGSIVVVELSLTNPKNFHSYVLSGFVGGMDMPIILLSIVDANHDGKPDLLIQVKGTTFQTVLYNTGTAFSEREG